MSSGITMNVTDEFMDELVERAAMRAAELIAEKSAGQGRWLRGAAQIGAYIAAPSSRVKGLRANHEIPVHKDGSALVAHTDELDAWLRAGGGRRL